MTKDPKRLVETADELGAAIAGMRKRTPSEQSLEALARRLAAAGAPVESVGEPPAGEVSRLIAGPKLRAASGTRFVSSGTILVGLALLVGAGLIAVAHSISPTEVSLPPPVAPAPTPVAPTATAQAAAPPGNPSPEATVREPSSASGATRPGTPELGTAAAAAPTALPTAPPAASSAEAPAVPGSPAPHGVGATSAPGASVTSTAPSRNPGSARPTARTSPENQGAPLAENTVVESEVELLKRAKSALGADPLQAYALTERCRGQYPNGSFAQEREYIAISALGRLGRTDEARSRAALFRMHYPNSAYLTRLAPLLGEP